MLSIVLSACPPHAWCPAPPAPWQEHITLWWAWVASHPAGVAVLSATYAVLALAALLVTPRLPARRRGVFAAALAAIAAVYVVAAPGLGSVSLQQRLVGIAEFILAIAFAAVVSRRLLTGGRR